MPPSPRPSLPRTVPLPLALLAAALLLALGACSSPLSMEAKETDPGIAASLTVVESRTQALFDELGRNAAGTFAEFDAIHYRPLLNELSNAQNLAHLHKRPAKEIDLLNALQATYDQMRGQHREGKLSFTSLQDFRSRLSAQIDALKRMEQR
jgi:hypothetical protein